VLTSEMGDAIEIESISFRNSPASPDPSGSYDDLEIHIGLCDSDVLGSTYADNFIAGTRTLVLSSSLYSTGDVAVGEWFDFELDTPYWYNGQDNLLIEVIWPSGLGSLYPYAWETNENRSCFGTFASTSGAFQTRLPHMMLNGTLELSNTTFGEIKATFL